MKELRILEEKLDALYIKRADAQSVLEHNSANVSFLEDHVEILQQKLRVKRDDLLLQENEIKNTEEIVLLSDDTKLGLCIRYVKFTISLGEIAIISTSLGAFIVLYFPWFLLSSKKTYRICWFASIGEIFLLKTTD